MCADSAQMTVLKDCVIVWRQRTFAPVPPNTKKISVSSPNMRAELLDRRRGVHIVPI